MNNTPCVPVTVCVHEDHEPTQGLCCPLCDVVLAEGLHTHIVCLGRLVFLEPDGQPVADNIVEVNHHAKDGEGRCQAGNVLIVLLDIPTEELDHTFGIMLASCMDSASRCGRLPTYWPMLQYIKGGPINGAVCGWRQPRGGGCGRCSGSRGMW